ncbi:MAG: hypothetical protein ACI8RZ_005272, partial [Myxococcota bacterium]
MALAFVFSCKPDTENLPAIHVQVVSAGRDVSCLLDSTGTVHCWGTEAIWKGTSGSVVVDQVPDDVFTLLTVTLPVH